MNYNQDLYYRVDSNNMMVTPPNWEGGIGKGDALWRTSMAWIAYGDFEFGDAVKSCFRKFEMINKKKYLYQGSRYINRYKEDDVSRDQTIMALSALKINDDAFLYELINHLPYKLSRRFNQTPTMWFWTKSLVNNSTFNVYMFHLMMAIELSIQIPITKLLRRLANLHKTTTEKPNKESLIYKIYDVLEFPGYAAHLSAWQMFTVRDTWVGKIAKKLLRWMVEDNNLLVHLLLRDNISNEEIENYTPKTEWRWSDRENGDYEFRDLKGDELNGNLLDKDILKKIKTLCQNN